MSVICLALLPSGPDAVRRLKLHRFRAAVRLITALAIIIRHPMVSNLLRRRWRRGAGTRLSRPSTEDAWGASCERRASRRCWRQGSALWPWR